MPEEPSREERIEAGLREILQQPDFPAVSQYIQQLMQALQDEESSLRYLTALVLRDYSLTLKVLRTANSAQYNRSGRPILSVSHAVVLLGAEAIRYLASSLALFEHFRRRAPGLRQLIVLSLLTANQARAAAVPVGYPRREEAYLCGMLCNLGELLIACYFPDSYAAILRRMQEEQLSSREACLQELHFAYEDLAQALVRHWNMPELIRRTIRDLEVKPPKGPMDSADLLSNLVSFSHGLTAAVYRREPEGARARVQLLIEDYLPVLPLRKEDVDGIVEGALLDTGNTFHLLGVPLDTLRLSRQAQAATSVALEPTAAPAESAEDLAELAGGTGLLERLTREVEQLLAGGGPFQLNSVLLMILEAIYRGGPFDRVLFCLVTPDHAHIRGRMALGEGAERLREHFRFPVAPGGGPIGAALHGKRALWLPAGGVGFAGARLMKTLGAASLGLLPVLVDGVLVGCLYFDRVNDKALPGPETVAGLEKLRGLAAAALKRSRVSGTGYSTPGASPQDLPTDWKSGVE